MWPSYLLFNKREDVEESDGENPDLVESYPCEQSPRDGKCRLSALPCLHFVEEQLPNDLVRVDTLFQKALEAGIRIKCRSVSREEICFLILCGKYIAIVLVDQYKLSPSSQDNVFISDRCGSNSDYTGHYVIICGYDTATDEFEIRDPACSRKHEKVSSTCLEAARKSFGTDEDLLLVSLSRKPDSPSIQLSRNDNINS